MYDQIMAVTFDTLKASQQLQKAGFDETKAEAIVSVFAGEVGASLATKDDLIREIAALRAEMKETEQRLTIRTGAMVGGGVAVILAALGIVTGIILAAA